MALLPASTNDQYRGAKPSAWFLAFLGFASLVPGCIHYFLPDGGAGVIAGIDLTHARATIVAAFAWMGATQIPYGLAQLAVATRYRALTPLFLALALLERTLAAVAAWITKASPTGHHPPENYAVVILIPFVLIFLVLSLRAKSQSFQTRGA
ncbi:hypothetical protein [Terricaulis sp.]|uniref:hypothetical protein n=1 Tax=Terricaulis sp. TaxID=2768686 RepID=UPI003783704F